MNTQSAGAFLIFLTCLMLALSGAAQGEVYKTVDKDGNVIYTDQPPEPGAEPMELPGLSIIESVPMKPPAATAGAAGEGEEVVTNIRELRRGYRDFRITSPAQDQWIEGEGNSVTINWDSRYALQPGMMVIISVDGKAMEPTTASSLVLNEVDRGEHSVSAQIVDAQNRKIATASPVTFHVRQFSQNFNRTPVPTPQRR